jgi:hypothetical protein
MLRFARIARDHLRCGTGELLVLRNIAKGPNDDLHGTSAALEFGVTGLEDVRGTVGWVLSRAAKPTPVISRFRQAKLLANGSA